ncbi:inositol monophosphatase [Microvirga tunisiensis]|uniref:Inositol monophosphatase n=2 Tax=Pannonibacter tanglangensis TaxID=2750084 RepID=A0ABW9ZGU3_9HYPH|nr:MULTISPECIES: inositol monophosphatase family protein [unclassified Pannonibacter]NBN64073.1 inositol monophosphatase [Pannonibacter sp. XCT-34]NBN77714.1 inositol monophosphatase [Pannonibacter sp. XCT-53]
MIQDRLAFALDLAERAGALGLDYFRRLETLTVTAKGHQDLVSEADRDVETLVRDALADRFPQDGIVGEEHGRLAGSSGFTWVIDPIDGTANFVAGIPQWCVVISCVHEGRTVIGITYDPLAREMFHAVRGGGAFVNGRPMRVSSSDSLGRGSVGVGFSGRTKACGAVQVIDALVDRGGVFFRNASGGLMLAYTASGRLIAYCEAHMHAWDCLAGLLMIEEAGGFVPAFDAEAALTAGVRVIAGARGIEADLTAICDASFPKVA